VPLGELTCDPRRLATNRTERHVVGQQALGGVDGDALGIHETLELRLDLRLGATAIGRNIEAHGDLASGPVRHAP
jgi:hypothetical protein